jgi:MOSC domain-containing protein YiiM
MATIVSLQVCPGTRKPMKIVRQAEFVSDLGLRGDAHAKAESSRQVLLLEKETLDALGLAPGQIKENVTTGGIALMSMKAGDRLRMGSEVLLEITKPCSPCGRMEEVRPGLLLELAGKRGMLARVAKGGIVHVGDTLEVVKIGAE